MRKLCLMAVLLFFAFICKGGTKEIIPLHVDGRYFKDPAGNVVNLHGFAQTYSPYFNEGGTKWNDYNVDACLKYNQGLIDKILNIGWKVNFVRLHMDPYWSNTPGVPNSGENDISAFSFDRFKKYLAEVFIPMAKYISGKGMYVVMRPPGVCPDSISLNDDYQKYLLKVWDYVSQQPELKDNPAIMYELANEPIGFKSSQKGKEDEEMTLYMQAIVDKIREHCNNIILVPGLGWQSSYSGFVNYPIKGDNIGFAVHCYPGFLNGAHEVDKEQVIDYENFKKGWNENISCICVKYPVIVTEVDWAPVKYNASWGKSTTGTVGSTGFGANFKQFVDREGNVSWLIFSWPHLMAKYDGVAATANNTTFFNDPEACLWPSYHWFQDYANSFYPSNEKYEQTVINPYVLDDFFPLTNKDFNPSIYADGTFDENTGNLVTGQWGFGGWEYDGFVDLSDYKYLIAELNTAQSANASFRIFDESDYFTKAAEYDFGTSTRIVVDLQNMVKAGTSTKCNPSHVFRVGFWSHGGKAISIKKVYLSNDGKTEASGINAIISDNLAKDNKIYNVNGQFIGEMAKNTRLSKGIYIINHKKVVIK